MAKDDPRQLLKDAAETLRTIETEEPDSCCANSHRRILNALADALDPKPEPKAGIPPGELVVADSNLRITTTHGLAFITGTHFGPIRGTLAVPTNQDIREYTDRWPATVREALESYARLVVKPKDKCHGRQGTEA